MDSFTERFIFLPLFTLLLALAVLSLVFPDKAETFKRTRPFAYASILCLSAVIQFPLLMKGFLEMGIAYSNINRSSLFDISIAALPVLYLALFALSIYCQRKSPERIEKTSLTLAVYTSFIIGPFAYLFLMGILYYFFR